MGKLDYLSKYTDKKKKSSKKLASNIVTNNDTISSSHINEDLPTFGETKFKGFKRIDNQQLQPAVKTDNEQAAGSGQTETVYRDLTGKVVDISQIKASLKPSNRVVLNESKSEQSNEKAPKSFTVSKSDKMYNDMLKSRTNFEDPIKSYAKVDKLSYIKGVNIPNRFGIKAGIMWDGIDRSNGFEKLVMRKRSQMKSSSKAEVNEYEMDFE
ncbi:Pre-mRNA-splicing factor cwc26 [Yamadazyma tenuis]|uniref:Pre-mRNA-splicing factor CWC26 n=1 Tax=Candida tenuis (strain ATCC 10573 / BCRC 21748 / CBS 615 / JCM 9827 / NBRC 10315 / NRRL Y-1498 / VKM Y-70) TaxID=590646 RepID=G3AYK0_CANTC|nr:uncharacterized protein CANTEDRAFT_112739 [Yamadazyma tenuis ATCC 10573]EGV65869.1 hypothetical protein CANTEDRAFT_112739 [Yamadazyma tenuis ATCC 10573]WEJ95799.1 Pre-mRNA-splicing factor cwc26 [Yamadazyma tenuis]